MFNKKKDYPSNSRKVDTLIGKDTIVKGTINGKGTIRLDGQLEGDVITNGDVVIGEGGLVNGIIKAKNVTVAGRLNGNAVSENRLEVRAGGFLGGDVETISLIIDDGAHFSGNCSMGKKTTPTKTAASADRNSSWQEKSSGNDDKITEKPAKNKEARKGEA